MVENNDLISTPNANTLRLIFAKIYAAIGELEARIHTQRGWWVFKEHEHSQDDLLSDPAFERIYSLTGNLDSIVQNWNSHKLNSSISEDDATAVQVYFDGRVQIENKLSELRKNIILRESTKWEQFLEALELLIKRVMRAIPAIASEILSRIGIQPNAQQIESQDRASRRNSFLDGKV